MVLEGETGCGKLTAVRHVAFRLGIEIKLWYDCDFDSVSTAKLKECMSAEFKARRQTINVFVHVEEWTLRFTAFTTALAQMRKSRIRIRPTVLLTTSVYHKRQAMIRKLGDVTQRIFPLEYSKAEQLLRVYAKTQRKPFDQVSKFMLGYSGDVRSLMRKVDICDVTESTKHARTYFTMCQTLFNEDGPLAEDEDEDAAIHAIVSNYQTYYDQPSDVLGSLRTLSDVSDALSVHDAGRFYASNEILFQTIKTMRPRRPFQFKLPKRQDTSTCRGVDYLTRSTKSYGLRESIMEARMRIGILKMPVIKGESEQTNRCVSAYFNFKSSSFS